MKLVVLGDVHGRSLWKSIIEKEKDADKFIFLGDYFDSKEGHSPDRQLFNFQELIDWRRARILAGYEDVNLLGNHDYRYLSVCVEAMYRGYQYSHAKEIRKALEDNMDILKMAHAEDKYIFSHAGISLDWLKANVEKEILKIKYPEDKLAEATANTVNELFSTRPAVFGFTIGPNLSYSGDDTCQTPIWIRPKSLMTAGVRGMHHIVGHTSVSDIQTVSDKNDHSEIEITFVDVQAENQYLIIDNGVLSTGKIDY